MSPLSSHSLRRIILVVDLLIFLFPNRDIFIEGLFASENISV
jgi:hypothetical protein